MAMRTIAGVAVRLMLVASVAASTVIGITAVTAQIDGNESAGTQPVLEADVNKLPEPKQEGMKIEEAAPQSPSQSEMQMNIPSQSATSKECADGSGSRSQLNLLTNSRVPGYC